MFQPQEVFEPMTGATVPALTAGQLMRPVPPLLPRDTLGKALHQFRQTLLPVMPVAADGYLYGWVSERRVADVVRDDPGALDRVAVEAVLETVPFVLAPSTTLDALTEALQTTPWGVIPVALADGRYLGLLVQADVVAAQAGRLTPPRVGGMATPLGVYLTTGTASGGVGPLGLVLTGMLMSLALWVTQSALAGLFTGLYGLTNIYFLRDLALILLGGGVNGAPVYELLLLAAGTVAVMVGFLALLRVMPLLAGYHAAEHMTVNALEAGEPLTAEAVGRMSRVHPRCGTNLVGVVSLVYLGVTALALALTTDVGRANISTVVSILLMLAAVVSLSWQRVGSFLQQHFTTRPPNGTELASGIRAGKEILRRHLEDPRPLPSFRQRLLQMGLIQVATGILLMGSLLYLVDPLLDVLRQILVK